MNKKSEIAQLLREITLNTKPYIFAAKVVSIDPPPKDDDSNEDDDDKKVPRTCTIDHDGLLITNVRLTPTLLPVEKSDKKSNGQNQDDDDDATKNLLVCTPQPGGHVLVGTPSGSTNDLCVLSCDALQDINLTIGKTNLVMDKTGVSYTDQTLDEKLDLRIGQLKTSDSNDDNKEEIALTIGKTNLVLDKTGITYTDNTTDGTPLNLKIGQSSSSQSNGSDETVKLTVGKSSVEFTKDLIKFNEGQNGGLVLSQIVYNKIFELQQSINDLKQVFNSWSPMPQDGGASLQMAIIPWLIKKFEVLQKTDFENKKITH